MKRKFGIILISLSVIFLIAISIFTVNNSNSEKQEKPVKAIETSTEITSLPEAVTETTAAETMGTPVTTTVIETIETTEDSTKNLPTLKLVVLEGPTVVDSNMCYYRIEAKATGDPYPAIKFSKDDSNGTWGKNIAQVNLQNGESYILVVTATNSFGKITKSIELAWSQ